MKKIIRSSTVPSSLDNFCRGVLRDLSVDYEVVALSSSGPEMDMIRSREGVRAIEVPMERHISPFKDFVSLLRIIAVFRRERPDMVHSMTPKAGLLCMMAAWLTHVPVRVHTFTGLVFPTATGLKKRILMLTDRITAKCATHIIPEGEGVKNDLISYGITKKPISVLGHGNVKGVDMNYYDRTEVVMAAAKALRSDSFFSFLFVGRIVHDKGIDELVFAFKRLSKEFPNIRLFLIGPNEDDMDPISPVTREDIKALDSVFSVGEKTGIELLSYYAASDCFVLPSYREGFPNTVLEAGAMGLPSIVTDINGSREIISNGYNGLIVPPHDDYALYLAMKKMLSDKEMRDKMASVCRHHIESYYEQGYVRQCLYDFYKTIL
ncbi:MAG: glycosyltransferase family 4 protein [Bacteroidales bacterium]|nr:glycosyltransferase family 4 protein [Bacteroidales bacterium]